MFKLLLKSGDYCYNYDDFTPFLCVIIDHYDFDNHPGIQFLTASLALASYLSEPGIIINQPGQGSNLH